jgi:hypothetical protein
MHFTVDSKCHPATSANKWTRGSLNVLLAITLKMALDTCACTHAHTGFLYKTKKIQIKYKIFNVSYAMQEFHTKPSMKLA